MSWPDTGTHLVLLPTGKVMSWHEQEAGIPNLWDPLTQARSVTAMPEYNIFCGGHAFLADGRLLVSGGHLDSNKGLPYASIYDPFQNLWTRLPNMNAGRWYPTNVLLPNGDMLVIAGTITPDLGENRLPQVWQPAAGAWRDLTSALRTQRTYPWMFVAPNGRVFAAGSDPDARYLDTTGTGAWETVASSQFGVRFSGTAVMYDDGKVMACGGSPKNSDMPTDTVEVIDLNQPQPSWRLVQSMRSRRKQHNSTLLPDGTVLITGGSSGPEKSNANFPVFDTELWDPTTEQFTLLADSAVFRGYHSAALLLPDGRVLSAGGEKTMNAQIFSPPYLFKGPPPQITSAPASIVYGQTFEVATPDASSIAAVTLLRLGAATHAFNQTQRFHRLSFVQSAAGVSVTAPINAVAAQPGYFMLFLVNHAGVPSVASFVRLQGPGPTGCGEVCIGGGPSSTGR